MVWRHDLIFHSRSRVKLPRATRSGNYVIPRSSASARGVGLDGSEMPVVEIPNIVGQDLENEENGVETLT